MIVLSNDVNRSEVNLFHCDGLEHTFDFITVWMTLACWDKTACGVPKSLDYG